MDSICKDHHQDCKLVLSPEKRKKDTCKNLPSGILSDQQIAHSSGKVAPDFSDTQLYLASCFPSVRAAGHLRKALAGQKIEF